MKDTEMNVISLRYTYSIRADGIDEHEYSLVALVSLDQVWQKCSYLWIAHVLRHRIQP